MFKTTAHLRLRAPTQHPVCAAALLALATYATPTLAQDTQTTGTLSELTISASGLALGSSHFGAVKQGIGEVNGRFHKQ